MPRRPQQEAELHFREYQLPEYGTLNNCGCLRVPDYITVLYRSAKTNSLITEASFLLITAHGRSFNFRTLNPKP